MAPRNGSPARTGRAPSDRFRVEVLDQTAHVTLNPADKYNGLDLAMLHALADLPRRIAADRQIRR